MSSFLNGSDSSEKTPTADVTSKNPATIGSSVSVKGEITGEEDVVIHGYVEGMINLKKNVVMVAKTGRVQAHIYGQIIHVEGEVTGNLFGTDQIVIHKSGNVKGNISAPRISIEDGARLKGSVDTELKPETAVAFKDAEVVRSLKTEETVISEALVPSNGKRVTSVVARP